ncbi:cilia- and flagella-associated protein 276 [Chanos chanos]|uniref:Cilia- and flagella-associated protein 276 n=1 Tax=Chanos chanos TaxID=29144 RepID=A0A6J2W7X0_CHACN|nr:uncharacterized protein C1orf194 homolog [Chanos chanos]
MPRERDPFPFPRYENDQTFTGRKQCQMQAFKKPVHIAQNDEPWSRLNDTATLASIRRNIHYYDKEAPRDSLDFHLKSTYDQHLEFLRNKNQTLYQRETFSHDHGRKPDVPSCNTEHREVRVWVNSQRPSIYSVQGAIESHHNASTNRGYSRKQDGGFYST